MKATLSFIVASMMIITTSLDAMRPLKTKKTPTEKCHEAIELRNHKKVKAAIKKGALVNNTVVYETGMRKNFLQLAIDTEDIPIIHTLLNAPKMDLTSYPMESPPPLHYAVFTGRLAIVRLFLNHPKTNINVLDSGGCTCLFTLLNSYLPSCRQIACELLNNNIDITIPNNNGDTILHCISQANNSGWIDAILNTKNPPLNTQNKIGDTPLHIACRMNAYLIIKSMLSSHHVINFKLRNQSKESPLDIALDSGYDRIFSLFFDKNPEKIMRMYHKDKRLFGYIIRANKPHLLKKILPSSYVEDTKNWTPLITASERGNADIVLLLLKQKNCNHLQKLKDGRIALHCASENGHLKCVKRLFEHDNNLDYQTHNENTALHLACANKHINVIDYLVEKGAQTLIKNKDDSVPFLLVYLKNLQDKIKKTTLNRMLHAKDSKDNTLFHIYTTIYAPQNSRSYDNYLKFLIEKGLNIYARNKNHLTALDMINNTYQKLPMSQIALSFWRVTSDHMQYALFKEILQKLPAELRIFILYFYYRLNINTILAKIIKRNPVLLSEHKGLEVSDLLIRLPNELHHFPLLYRPAGFSYE